MSNERINQVFSPSDKQIRYAELLVKYNMTLPKEKIMAEAKVTKVEVYQWQDNDDFIAWLNAFLQARRYNQREMVMDKLFENAMLGDMVAARIFFANSGGITQKSGYLDQMFSTELIDGGKGMNIGTNDLISFNEEEKEGDGNDNEQ